MRKTFVMEEKMYSQLDQEQGIDVASEPVMSVVSSTRRSVGGITQIHDRIDDVDWDRLPLLGPKTEEEAIASIDRFEERLAKEQVEWIPSEKAWAQLFSKYPWLR